MTAPHPGQGGVSKGSSVAEKIALFRSLFRGREDVYPVRFETAHVWLFFEEAITARLARNLGSCLLTETMERRPDIGLGSYDRLFPNQDTLPEGGFGNLIVLLDIILSAMSYQRRKLKTDSAPRAGGAVAGVQAEFGTRIGGDT